MQNSTIDSIILLSNSTIYINQIKQEINWLSVLSTIIPFLSLIATIYLAMYNAKINSNLSLLQIHKDNIVKSYEEILGIIGNGQAESIESYLMQPKSIYILDYIRTGILEKVKDKKGLLQLTERQELINLIYEGVFPNRLKFRERFILIPIRRFLNRKNN